MDTIWSEMEVVEPEISGDFSGLVPWKYTKNKQKLYNINASLTPPLTAPPFPLSPTLGFESN